jgi:hypothetical protein
VQWLAPFDVTPARLAERLQGWYEPLWLFDLEVDATWRAEGGTDKPFVALTDTLRTGDWETSEGVELRTEWQLLAGELRRSYQNVPAPAVVRRPALASNPDDALQSAEPWSIRVADSTPWCLPDLSAEDALDSALARARTRAAEECRQASGYAHIRNFEWEMRSPPEYRVTLLLVPAWSTYYLEDNGTRQVLHVSASSGAVTGRITASGKKQAILLAATSPPVLMVVTLLAGAGARTALIVSSLLALMALVAYAIFDLAERRETWNGKDSAPNR